MTESPDLTDCDREPIHIPGSIQPHGVLLAADPTDQKVLRVAGDVEGRLGVSDGIGRPLAALIGEGLAAAAATVAPGPQGAFLGFLAGADGQTLEASAHLSGDRLLVELEPAPTASRAAAAVLAELETAAAAFQSAANLQEVCDIAAEAFRALIGFDRVMVYRFLDDDSGRVISEARREGQGSFLNHHFPATDIPRQARALYVRNLVRAIPDVGYTPAPLRPADTPQALLDLGDSILRSVSPIHLQYLKNMGVGASASFSVVLDGVLWGLIACHNETPKRVGYETRAAGRALSGGLARQIKARAEAERYREHLRLRSFEEEIVALLSREGSLEDALSRHLDEVRNMLRADGVAVLRGSEMVTAGLTPNQSELRALAAWVVARGGETVMATERLAETYPPAAGFQQAGAGLMSLVLSQDEPWVLFWFRAEQVEVVEWAGNPHKAAAASGPLSPRASFEAWREVVKGRARRWTLPEVEGAGRLGAAVREVRQNRRLKELNRRLNDTLKDKDLLIEQKQYLIGEVNHRVQNSLQMVSSFLKLQARASESDDLKAAIDEANRRINAVALVHRRLYRGEQLEAVDVARYVEELCGDTVVTMGADWGPHLSLDLSPVMLPTDRAIVLGLVLTELMINANKYAYGGRPGPILVRLQQERANVQLVVADKGSGKATGRRGFGSRMMDALVGQFGGELTYEDNRPGLRATLIAPIGRSSSSAMQDETASPSPIAGEGSRPL